MPLSPLGSNLIPSDFISGKLNGRDIFLIIRGNNLQRPLVIYWADILAALPSGVTFQTDGVDNTVQNLLNLIEGTNVVLTDNSLGGVVVDSKPVSLPVPKVYLKGNRADIEWIDYDNNAPGGTLLTMLNTPHVVAMDIAQDILDEYRVFVEMVYYRRGKKAYVIPVPQSVTAGVATNTLEQAIGVPLATRGGIQKQKRVVVFPTYAYYDLNINRPNHYEVTSQNQVINVSDYFNGMFTQQNVEYNTIAGAYATANLLCTTPAPRRKTAATNGGERFAYRSTYQPLYVAFRYVAFDPKGNNNLGRFISGPLSKIVTVSNQIFPFIPQPLYNAVYGYPTCIPHPDYDKQILKCWFENRLP